MHDTLRVHCNCKMAFKWWISHIKTNLGSCREIADSYNSVRIGQSTRIGPDNRSGLIQMRSQLVLEVI